jgi:AcrR family transcriptional regulator
MMERMPDLRSSAAKRDDHLDHQNGREIDRGLAIDERRAPPSPDSLTVRQRDRRQRIISTAMHAMMRDDYDQVQMKDVASEAGVALGTMYHYFTSKEHLFAEALLAWRADYFHEVPEPSSRRAVDRLKAAYRAAIGAFERHPTVYSHMMVIQASNDPLAAALYRRFGANQNAAFAELLRQVPSPKREQIVTVMGAVLSTNLTEFSRGRRPIAEVYAELDTAADLLLG